MADEIDENKDAENLSSVLEILQRKNLITRIEKTKIDKVNGLEEKNAQIYQLLMKKDVKVSLNILLQMRLAYNKLDGNENEDWATRRNPLSQSSKNPLEVNTIVQEIFKYLKFQDLKSVGKVCHKWNIISQPFIRDLSEIRFQNPNLVLEKTVTDFLNIYKNCLKFRDIPYTSFNFCGYEECYTRNLTNFFRRQKKNISELTFFNVHLKTLTKTTEHYDISNWIVDLPLKKLHITCPNENGKTKLQVSIKSLTSIQDLLLNSCFVDVYEVAQISPKKIVLSNVTFYGGQDPIDNFRVNDVFKFDGAEYVEFSAAPLFTDSILDFCENVTVGSLKLISVGEAIENWECSRWKILNQLKLFRTPFIVKTQMRYRDLHVDESCIDLCVLRQTLEKLTIESSDIISTDADAVVLTKLKFLRLSGQNIIPFVSKFVNCYSLVDVELHGYKSSYNSPDNRTFDSDIFPRNIKRLKLYGVKMSGNNWNIPLQLLILQEYSFHKASALLLRLRPRVLVLNWKRNFEINDCVLKFLNSGDNIDTKTITIGPFLWDDFPFVNSCLAKYVDKEGKYYCFEGDDFKRGKSLSHLQFAQIQEL